MTARPVLDDGWRTKEAGADRWWNPLTRWRWISMNGRMTQPKWTIGGQIEAFIQRLDGVAVCDGCITDRLDLSVPSQANVVTRSLGGERRYERRKDGCGLCGATKLVIRHSR